MNTERLRSRADPRRCSAPHRLGKAQGSQLPLGMEQPQHLMMMNHFCAHISISRAALDRERMVPSRAATLGSLLS